MTAGLSREARPARSFDWTFLVWLLFAAILLFIVVNPLARLVLSSFERSDGSGYTLANYLTAYGRWRYIQALINTLVMGAGTAALATIFAVPLAWACARTDMPLRGFDQAGRSRRLHHAALPRGGGMDPAGGAQLGLDQ